MIFDAAGPSTQLVGVSVCLSYPGAWHFHKIARIHSLNYLHANYLAKKNQEAQVKKELDVMKKQKNEPPVNHGDQGNGNDDKEELTSSAESAAENPVPLSAKVTASFHVKLVC